MPDAQTPAQHTAHPSIFFTEYYGVAFLSLIAVFVLIASFVLKPMIDQIKQTNVDTQTELQASASEQTYLNSLEQSILAAQTISPTVLERVAQALPLEANTPALLVQFGSAAYTNGVQIDAISFAENKATSRLMQSTISAPIIPIDISLSLHAASYFDLKRFLADLETSLRVIDVVSMTTGGGQEDISYALQLRAYAFGGQATATAPK